MTDRVLIYARYSSELQSDASIEDQVRQCRAIADQRGWKVVGVEFDAALSGALRDRPGFQRLTKKLCTDAADIVMAESLDRFSRDQEHMAGFYKIAEFNCVRVFTQSDGFVDQMHVGLKGVMSALFLKDLAQKTHRGLEGCIRQGRGVGKVSYGYRIQRRIRDDGSIARGLREIDTDTAAIVQRIFRDYADGASPLNIASRLNQEGVPSPGGTVWFDTSIRGREARDDGILRNQLYVGRQVWNRQQNVKDPTTGVKRRRRRNPDELIVQQVPELRIIDDVLWDRVQQRLQLHQDQIRGWRKSKPAHNNQDVVATATGSAIQNAYWTHRRPKHLLSNKVHCGVCGRVYTSVGGDYLGCLGARNGACRNNVKFRRPKLEAMVVNALQTQFLPPDLMALFVKTFNEAWVTLVAEANASMGSTQRQRDETQRKINNLVDAIANGNASASLRGRLAELEATLESLDASLQFTGKPCLPTKLQGDIAQIYRDQVADLRQVLTSPDAVALREMARSLIDKIVVTPPETDDDPPGIELFGDLKELLLRGGLYQAGDLTTRDDQVLDVFISSVKEAPGARPLVGFGAKPLALLPPASRYARGRRDVPLPAELRTA